MSIHFRHPRYADIVATLALVLATGGTAYAVTALPANSVGTAQLKSGAVTAVKIKTGAVQTDKIADGSVDNAKLADGSVTGSKLAADSVTGPDIASHSISLGNMVGTDVHGGISFTLGAGVCATLTMGVGGAQVGQAAFLTWIGNVTPPSKLMTGPLKVSAANTVLMPVCNEGTSTLSVSDIGVRVDTFG